MSLGPGRGTTKDIKMSGCITEIRGVVPSRLLTNSHLTGSNYPPSSTVQRPKILLEMCSGMCSEFGKLIYKSHYH